MVLREEMPESKGHRLTNVLGVMRSSWPNRESPRGRHKQHDSLQRAGSNVGYRHKAVSRRHSRREVSWKDPDIGRDRRRPER